MLSFRERLERVFFDTDNVPEEFIDCISRELMEDPVTLSDGHIYDRDSAIDILRRPRDQRNSPFTREALDNRVILDAHFMRSQIIQFVEDKERYARPYIERINRLTQELDQKAHDLEDEVNQRKRLRDELKEAQAEHAKTQTSLKKAKKDLSQTQTANQSLSGRLDNAQSQIETLQKQLEQAQENSASKGFFSSWFGFGGGSTAETTEPEKRAPEQVPTNSGSKKKRKTHSKK